MAGLAGLVRARQYIWISDEVSKMFEVELPFDDGMNEMPNVDMLRCLHDHNAPPPLGHDHPGRSTDQPAMAEGMPGMTGGAGMAHMGGMGGVAE